MWPFGSPHSIAFWPSRSVKLDKSINFKDLILGLVVLGSVLLLKQYACTSVSANELSRPWPSKKLVGPVRNAIIDERDNSLYLAVDHFIYKYSQDLQLLSSSSSSTSLPNESLAKLSSNSSQSNSITNKLLFILRKNSPELILACWQTNDLTLKCGLSKSNELKAFIPLPWGGGVKGYRIENSDRILASSSDINDLILTTSRSANQDAATNSLPSLPAIARYKLTKHPGLVAIEPKSVLPFGNTVEGLDLLNDYVYSFIHEHNTYFLLNDIRRSPSTNNLRESVVRARLARVCNNDTELTSYTEISLTCKHPKENLFIRYASYGLSTDEPTLSVVFETIDEQGGLGKKYSAKSILCIYSMKFIVDYYHKATGDCYRGNQNTMLLKKLHSESITAPFCQKSAVSSEDWCTSNINPFIDATSSDVTEDSYIDLRNIAPVNFIFSTKQGSVDARNILFIGTETGYLIKMNGDQDEEIHFVLDVNRGKMIDHHTGLKFDPFSKVEVSTRFFTSSRDIVALDSDGLAQKFSVDSCYYYASCKSCLSARDPLDCIWCNDKCSSRTDCPSTNSSLTSCPPIVSKFYPTKGPLTGQTKLVLEGENFGTSKGEIKVSAGESECVIDVKVRTDNFIECYLKPVASSKKTSIEVEVKDVSSYIYAQGKVQTSELYTFENVIVYGLEPSYGSIHEKNVIKIHGENLDAGANRSILIGLRNCIPINVSAQLISCIIGPIEFSAVEPSLLKAHALKVMIDGTEQPINYTANFANLSLSQTFLLKNASLATPIEDQSIQNVIELESKISLTLLLFALLTAVTLTLICVVFKRDVLSILKSTVPNSRKSSKVDDLKVTFRNPDSQKFADSVTSIHDESPTGLVRLNGSAVSSGYFGKYDQFEQDKPLISNSLDDELISVLTHEKILIDRAKLTLGHVLGSGQFGRVYKGFLKVEDAREMIVVAVKSLHNKSSWYDSLDNRAFLEEGLMMRDFEHENVLALIGVTFESNGLPMVITPFMLYGDLRSYISDEASSPTVRELIDFGTQVAKGMAYLSNLKFVHRDLAARNCMLDEDLVVKVADFGLSRDIYERDYYSSDNQKTKLPVKWMAPESLEKSIYNAKTDVWSYGVLLWELMTRGVVPYPDVDNFDIYRYLKEGRRMLRPRYCPVLLYKIMLSCWDEDPGKRPSFDELVVKVSDVINQLKTAKDGQQKVRLDETW